MITAVDKLNAITDAGYRVYVSHQRRVCKFMPDRDFPDHFVNLTERMMTAREATADGWTIKPNGGSTTVEVCVVDGDRTTRIARGMAICSLVDRFERQIGLHTALQRAIAEAPELRAVIQEMVQAKAAAS